MKRFLGIITSILLLQLTSAASVDTYIPSPEDDPWVKLGLDYGAASEEVKADREAWRALEERLRAFPESKLRALFHPVQDSVPAGYVLPANRRARVEFFSLGYEGQGKCYFLSVGDVGGLLVFPFGRRDQVSSVTLYLKKDPDFVPIRSKTDYASRRQWEIVRADALKKHIHNTLSE